MKFLKTILSMALVLALLGSMLSISVFAADTGGMKLSIGFVNTAALRLRAGPSINSATITNAYQNEVVVILERVGNWYRVLYDLKEGYMHGQYLKVYQVENVELGYGKVNYSQVNMRSGPSTSYSRIGQSGQGDLAYIIGLNNGWYKVIWNDRICYIRSDYLTLTEIPYENRRSANAPLFFRGGKSTGRAVSASALKQTTAALASKIVATAKNYLGVPYVWGGQSPSGFDCSGFVQYVFQRHGVSLNRTVRTQYTQGTTVSKQSLKAGDLVFFQNTSGSGLSHIGIYIGNDQFIHASSSKGVMVSSLSNSYWLSHYHSAKRVL